MASLVSLSTLIARVRQRANLEGATAFIPDSEITDSLNVALAEVYDLLRENVGDNYFRKTFTLTTTQSVTLYTLPSDFLSVISVDIWLGGSFPLSGRRYFENQRNLLRAWPFGWDYTRPVFYQVQGSGASSSINFLSAPNAGFRVDINYCPVPTPLVNNTDTWDDINSWAEMAVLDAAVKCCIKDGQLDVANCLDTRKERMRQRIQAMGPQRHAGEPEQVNIIANRTEWSDGWWGD